MRQVTRNGLLTVFAAGGVLAASGGVAFADSEAEGGAANSPGVISGNSVQAPIHVPVNVCGNTVNVAGLLNPAFGNTCVNAGDGGARATGGASGSPGFISGNSVQAPIDIPVNACGNSVDVVGALNPTTGNECANGVSPVENAPNPEAPPEEPKTPVEEEPAPEGESPAGESPEVVPEETSPEPVTEPVAEQPTATEETTQLAATGGNFALLAAVPVGAGLVLGGALLYRRSRMVQQG
ncbi:chaplin family protein [Streptomyces sp. DSM 44915]|uniref:Chaplin family protein n=1 Tax=Streptomyces chisholmiae TaxID=3075540 RepID=A0ABU2JY88_9ACTN|nr:chaplin family protein [Streptomyces sp. DSM 44915]MDT0269912.1 chaplin family protein [Streptomyces sp. DSM 44915]